MPNRPPAGGAAAAGGPGALPPAGAARVAAAEDEAAGAVGRDGKSGGVTLREGGPTDNRGEAAAGGLSGDSAGVRERGAARTWVEEEVSTGVVRAAAARRAAEEGFAVRWLARCCAWMVERSSCRFSCMHAYSPGGCGHMWTAVAGGDRMPHGLMRRCASYAVLTQPAELHKKQACPSMAMWHSVRVGATPHDTQT